MKCLPHTPSLDLETTVGLVQLLVRLRWNDDAVALTQHIVKHSNLAFDDVRLHLWWIDLRLFPVS